MTTGRVVVIGVGNPYRRDDGFGPAVVTLLRGRRLPGVELAESDGEMGALIELWTGAALAVVVDAVRAQPSRPGRVHRLSAHHPAYLSGYTRSSVAASTHGVDLGEAVELARVLDRMPDRLLLFAAEVAEVGFGVGLTPAVAAAASAVAAEVAELVAVEVAQ